MKRWEQEDARAIEKLKPLLHKLSKQCRLEYKGYKKAGSA